MQRKRSLGLAYRFRPRYPDFLHGAPPTSACAAFIEESRIKCANASKLRRKSGVRWGEPGAPVCNGGFLGKPEIKGLGPAYLLLDGDAGDFDVSVAYVPYLYRDSRRLRIWH